MLFKFVLKSVFVLIMVAGITQLVRDVVHASENDCDTNYYGGGEVCNKSFRIRKYVRVEDEDTDWTGKVYNVAVDDEVQFRIEVENVGEVTVDDMKYEDFLPDEMSRTGGDGLTEYWDDFAPGDVVKFTINAEVDSDEYDRENFEKCVVNKVELYYGDAFEGSDTATVCYTDSEEEITELPETGPTAGAVMAIVGLATLAFGMFIRRRVIA